jgi:hypothetical protein
MGVSASRHAVLGFRTAVAVFQPSNEVLGGVLRLYPSSRLTSAAKKPEGLQILLFTTHYMRFILPNICEQKIIPL